MGYKICLVSPDQSISRTAAEVVRELGSDLRCDLTIIDGNVQTSVKNVRPYVENGVDAIISRGGTAMALKEAYPDVPVIAIQIEATDILKAIRTFPKGTKIGLISYSEIVYQYQAVAELLGAHDITFFRLFQLGDEDKEIDQYVQDACNQGIEALIGSIHVRSCAKKYNLKFAFLSSGKNAILHAIREAAATTIVRQHDQDAFRLIADIVNYTFMGTAVFDRQGNLQTWNPAFAAMFPYEEEKTWKQYIQRTFFINGLKKLNPHLRKGMPLGNEVIQVDARSYAVTWQPVWEKKQMVRAIAFVQPVEQLQSYALSVRKGLSSDGLVARYKLEDIVGESVAICRVKREVVKYARTHSNVLITGESGTGKEMLAQAIHNLSYCCRGPFVAINCGAFTESLLESELFGYEEGTFTGAKKGGKMGVFELADGGTLFLDEIGDMPYVLQNRLLRVLQERAIMRVGGNKVIPVNVRIIAATNQDLRQAIEDKQFRLDLYYRLNVLRIHVPPLREREGDIPLLAQLFLYKLNREYGYHKEMDPEILLYLKNYPWKGNIRQLANVIERMVLLSETDKITVHDAAEALELPLPKHIGQAEPIDLDMADKLLAEGKTYNEIAELLGVSRSTLWRHRKKIK